MSIPDDQLTLLATAVAALHTWQNTADSAGVLIQQVVMEFPPDDQPNAVIFTWDATAERFDISTDQRRTPTPAALPSA